MNKKLIFTIPFVLIFIFSFGQDKLDEDQCEKLKHQNIDFSRTDTKHLQQQIFKMMVCGFDSIDCKIAGPILGTIMVNRISQNGDTTIKFGFLISLMNQLKSSQEYAEVRREMVIPKETARKIPAFLNYPQYFDYEEGIKRQKTLKKPLLIYFSARFSAGSRRMEEEVLSDTSIMPLLHNFIIVTLYVDDNKVGKINAKLQVEKYKGNVQPDFIKQSIDGKWTRLSGYLSKEEFERFLNHPSTL